MGKKKKKSKNPPAASTGAPQETRDAPPKKAAASQAADGGAFTLSELKHVSSVSGSMQVSSSAHSLDEDEMEDLAEQLGAADDDVDTAAALTANLERKNHAKGQSPKRKQEQPQEQKQKQEKPGLLTRVSGVSHSMQGLVCLVTGAAGFVGRRLTAHLLDEGAATVHMFDIAEAVPPEGYEGDTRIRRLQGNILKIKHVEDSMKGVDVVFHIASYGMSGSEMGTYAVNVRGTRNVVESCLYLGVPRLVYTSTYNVVFGGAFPRSYDQQDESVEYLPVEDHCDNYSKTKAVAEQLVLRANDTGSRLRTCAVRPAAIYGEGESRHFPRIVNYVERGLYCVRIGDASTKVDWVHVDNLCSAHILAARALTADPLLKTRPPSLTQLPRQIKAGKSAGKAYFISDGVPVNNDDFMQPLVEAIGYQSPSIRVPYSWAFYAAWGIELVHSAVKRCYKFQPLLSRAEVNKIAVTHTFRNDRASKDLGYKVVVKREEGVKRMGEYLVQDQLQRTREGRRPRNVMGCIVAVGLLFLLSLLALGVLVVWGEEGALAELTSRLMPAGLADAATNMAKTVSNLVTAPFMSSPSNSTAFTAPRNGQPLFQPR